MATRYSFITRWSFDASAELVWDLVSDALAYPRIWPDFKRVTLISGDGRSVGSVVEAVTRGSLPYSLTYRLTLLESERPRHILLRSTGDLEGTGRWELTSTTPEHTDVAYHWEVATTKPLLNLMAPLLKGVMAHNHDVVMAHGYSAFAAELRRRAAA